MRRMLSHQTTQDDVGNHPVLSALTVSMTPTIDFQVAEVVSDGRVTGRNCGADILVGTVFSSLCRREFPVLEPGEDIVSPELVYVCDVSLRLDGVVMYRHLMDSLDSGHTAMLSLSGSGFAAVSSFVSSASKHTYYSLCA
jgi:hypothetical protein